MTKGEALIEMANRQDRIVEELKALAKLTNISAGHEAMVIASNARFVSERLRKLAKYPSLQSELTFKDPA